MKCPVCNDIRMREVEKDGVLIDICPECKGVWLDRGELDKLMLGVREMRKELEHWEQRPIGGGYDTPPAQPMPPGSVPHEYDRRYGDHHKHNQYGYDKRGYPYKKKKKNVLDVFGDLFD